MHQKTKDRKTSKDTSNTTGGTKSQDASGPAKNPMLAEALKYADAGLKIFPLHPRSKKPLTANGFKDATTDRTKITRWWTKSPSANIGLSCRANDLVGIDVDNRNGGKATLADLQTKLGAVPITATSKTGSREGGRHYIHKLLHECSLIGKMGLGVDVKWDGYLVVPPSVHPDGGVYEWQHSPFEVDFAELPFEWGMALIKDEPKAAPAGKAPKKERTTTSTTTPYGRAAIERELKAVRDAPEGERNDTLFKGTAAIGQLHAGGEIVEDVREELVRAAMVAGLPEAEARRAVESGWAAGLLEPRSAPAKEGETSETRSIDTISEEEKRLIQAPWAEAKKAKQRDSLVHALAQVAKKAGYRREDVAGLVEELAVAVGDHHIAMRVAKVQEVYSATGAQAGGWGVLRQFGLSPSNLPSLVSPTAAERDSMPARLVQIVQDEVEIVCDERSDAYANIEGRDGNQLLPVRGAAFKGFLAETEFDRSGRVPGSETIRAALTIIESRARRGRRVSLANRVARGEDGAIWLDMADKNGRAIRITSDGWDFVDRPPPLFRRYAHQQPLPIPVRGGNAWKILDYVNLPNPKDQILYVISTVTALVPDIPQPLLIHLGPQGSAKTSAARAKRRIVDPSATPTLITKNDPGELVLALDQNYMPILDNVTSIVNWYSDILCQAVTGGSFSKRQLYTDQDQVLLTFRRPITMTALTMPRTPADLPDRALVLNFDRIESTHRMRERDLWTKFEADLPGVFGGILDLLVHAMLVEDIFVLPELPRMADFAQWGAAAASAVDGGQDRFLEALADNGNQRDIMFTDDDVVGAAIKKFALELESAWHGSPTELWNKLSGQPGVDSNWREWPHRAAGLSKRLIALQPVLASQGIIIRSYKRHGNRYWEITTRDLQG